MTANRIPYFACMAVLFLLLISVAGIACYRAPSPPLKPWAEALLLTDFCFTTEARYLRHFNTFEPLAVFQDLPGYHEHAPASPFIPPLHVQSRVK
ncbi:MAG: hypothetical protein RMJ87_09065 [Cytophagales bacterium]|nr:hypothetical protein [Bernardetiaceae bacterium]MDW8205164.1 hypothetical protein [Cytophagales bacterium]